MERGGGARRHGRPEVEGRHRRGRRRIQPPPPAGSVVKVANSHSTGGYEDQCSPAS